MRVQLQLTEAEFSGRGLLGLGAGVLAGIARLLRQSEAKAVPAW